MPNSVFFYSNSIVLPIILYTMSKRIGEGFKGERAIILPYNIRDLLAKNPITEQLYVTHIGYYPLRNTIIENARKVPINTFLFFAKRAVVGSNLIMKFTDLRAKCHLFYP